MSYLSQPEIDALNASDLSRTTPFPIQGVSQGMFSIARHYGGAKFNGSDYAYIPEHDELVRDDVVKFVAKMRKPKRRNARCSNE
jgi:hypothetical protein